MGSEDRSAWGNFMPCKTVMFEKGLAICGGIAEKVTYEAREGSVIAHGSSGLSGAYKIANHNTMSMEMPGFGVMVFNRKSY